MPIDVCVCVYVFVCVCISMGVCVCVVVCVFVCALCCSLCNTESFTFGVMQLLFLVIFFSFLSVMASCSHFFVPANYPLISSVFRHLL